MSKFGVQGSWFGVMAGIFSMYLPMMVCAVRYVDEPGGGGETAWYETPGLVSDPSILTDKDKEYKSFDDYVKGAQHARGKMTERGIPVPGEKATDDERNAFRGEVAKHFPDHFAPASADKYEIAMFADEQVNLSKEIQGELRADFHAAGFSNKNANAALDIYAKFMAKDTEEVQASFAALRGTTEKELKAEWGADYAERQTGIARVGEKYPELFKWFKDYGLDGRKDFQTLMDEVARGTAEDRPGAGGGGETAESIDAQIKAVKESKEYKTGNSFERKEQIKKLDALYKQREKFSS